MQIEECVNLLLTVGALKRLPRTGWRLAGIENCESVADHSFRVAIVALLLGDLVPGVNRERLLRMALVHELPESLITDLPWSSVNHLGKEAKQQAERSAFRALATAGTPADDWRALWEEFEAGHTAEARLARAADRLELLLQAYEYERTGYRDLDSFWRLGDRDHQGFEVVGRLFEELAHRRSALGQ